MPGTSIWDLALQQSKEKNDQKQSSDSTILFVGNKSAGKSTVIYRFVERSETPKPTLALEYLYARHSRSAELSTVCHIWELGGGTLFTPLLDTPIKEEYLNSLSLVLVLDLSNLSELWCTLDILLKEVKNHVQKELKNSDNKSLQGQLSDNSWKRVGNDHPDHSMIEPFPLPVLILGSKYDLFQEVDPEIRKIVCRTLRFVAHSHGAMLQFVSMRMENSVNWCRQILTHFAFNTGSSKNSVLDYTKPIFVPFGGDSLELIGGIPKLENYSGKTLDRCLENWKDYLSSVCPQVEAKEIIPEDPGKDSNFVERDIDLMRAQKDKELEEYIKRQRHIQNDIDFG